MPRIPYLDASQVSDAGKTLLEATGNSNLWRMFLHHEKLSHQLYDLGAGLLREGLLEPTHREIAILTIGRLCKSTYEIHHHTEIARMLGFPERKLLAVLGGDASLLEPVEGMVMRFASELSRNGVVSDETFAELRAIYDPAQMIELTVVCGFYTMASAFLNTFEVEIEASKVRIPSREAHIEAAARRR
jgi:4-carboxymuconolactone decarboxylase